VTHGRQSPKPLFHAPENRKSSTAADWRKGSAAAKLRAEQQAAHLKHTSPAARLLALHVMFGGMDETTLARIGRHMYVFSNKRVRTLLFFFACYSLVTYCSVGQVQATARPIASI
jgi:hypothetical protein